MTHYNHVAEDDWTCRGVWGIYHLEAAGRGHITKRWHTFPVETELVDGLFLTGGSEYFVMPGN